MYLRDDNEIVYVPCIKDLKKRIRAINALDNLQRITIEDHKKKTLRDMKKKSQQSQRLKKANKEMRLQWKKNAAWKKVVSLRAGFFGKEKEDERRI